MKKELVTPQNVKAILAKKGYPFFEKGDFNLNFGGIRSEERVANKFDDFLYLYYRDRGEWRFWVFEATLDPGTFWLKNPMSAGGAGIIAPNFYRGLFQFGPPFHGVDCLRQKTAIQIYRDDNRDNIIDLDPKTLQWGFFGIFEHESYQATEEPENVDKSSAACVVPRRKRDHQTIMAIVKKAILIWGNSISFAVLEEKDFI